MEGRRLVNVSESWVRVSDGKSSLVLLNKQMEENLDRVGPTLTISPEDRFSFKVHTGAPIRVTITPKLIVVLEAGRSTQGPFEDFSGNTYGNL